MSLISPKSIPSGPKRLSISSRKLTAKGSDGAPIYAFGPRRSTVTSKASATWYSVESRSG
jgi:hypothetical protein